MLAALTPQIGAYMNSVACVPCLRVLALSATFKEDRCSLNSLFVCRWAEVQLLVNSKSLLFYASDAQTKANKVIKYVTRYGHEVHQLLSDAGLAPNLYRLVQLPGAFMQVSLILGQICCILVGLITSCHVLCPGSMCYGFRVMLTICR